LDSIIGATLEEIDRTQGVKTVFLHPILGFNAPVQALFKDAISQSIHLNKQVGEAPKLYWGDQLYHGTLHNGHR
jgi:hypothetical protein